VTVRSAAVVAAASKSGAMPFGWTSAVVFAVVGIVILSLVGTAFARRRQHTPAHAPTYESDDVPAPMA
jgi:membrane protein implicated in regulation of membrane protease activity